jgi:hypothetical protein
MNDNLQVPMDDEVLILPVPEDEEPPLPVVRPPRTRTRLKRWKLLLIVLSGIVILSVVFGMFSRSASSGAVQTTGVTHQSTPDTASTPKPRSAPATPSPTAHRSWGSRRRSHQER